MISPCYFGPPVLGDPVYMYVDVATAEAGPVVEP
jgi:hypothetical protein